MQQDTLKTKDAVKDASTPIALSKSDMRYLRRVELMKAFAQATRNDLAVHPWKLFFLVFPFLPPFTGVLTVGLTALHFKLGLTSHARAQRAIMAQGARKEIDLKEYESFLIHDSEEEQRSSHPSHIQKIPKLDRKRLQNALYYQTMIWSYERALDYAPYARKMWGGGSSMRFLERRHITTKNKFENCINPGHPHVQRLKGPRKTV